MKSKYIAVLFVALGIIGAGTTLAYGGMGSAKYNPELHTQIMDAIEAGNYSTWKSLMESNNLPMKHMTDKITAENFVKMQELHNAMISGDYETANKIRQELGLGYGQIKNTGMHRNSMGGNGQGRMSMRFVDSNGDGVCDNKDI
jgi:hypothetical protein